MTPYDTWSYFFIVAAIAAFHGRRSGSATLLAVVMLLGTLLRETQALAVAYTITWTLVARAGDWRRPLIAGGVFLLTYLSLRLALGLEKAVVQPSTKSRTPRNPTRPWPGPPIDRQHGASVELRVPGHLSRMSPHAAVIAASASRSGSHGVLHRTK